MDNVDIFVIAGSGGNGFSSFRHEKYVLLGGPDGGDGGNGGHVYIRSDKNISNLSSFRHKKVFRAGKGINGGKQKKHGKNGTDLILMVPLGTVVFKIEEDKKFFMADLDNHYQQILVAKGGRGGLGNVHFATSTNQAPKTFTEGEKGDELRLILDLKLIADVGIVGFPNAGKSTLLSAISAARPKIADYQFTTLEPVLGEVHLGKTVFVVAEIPGLIKGAHLGKGLGHNFLRHAERTRILVHLLDGSSSSILDDMSDIEQELALYHEKLAQRHRIIAVNKIDLPEVQSRLPELKKMFISSGMKVFFISAFSGQGIPELISELGSILAKVSKPELLSDAPIKIFRPKPKNDKR